MKQKDPVWLFYSALDDEKRLVLGVWTVINAEVIAKVLRLKSHREKCQELIKTKTKSKPVKRPFE